MCKDLDLDGLTPDVNVIKNTLKSINIPIKVMIRPRAGNFIYQFDEVKKMEQQIDLCKELDIPEIVIGALTNSANVDIQLTKRLASRAYPMNVTFHKAIDYTEDLGRFGSYKSDGSFTRRGIKKGIKCFANIRFPEF